ncbi:MAG: ATP-binding protein [Saprospiraceae bacterium]|nr:ATP-binding protein [Saprospiraceae bacterium]
MDKFIHRAIEPELKRLLSYFPAVGIVGARQVGKTTLVKALDDNFVYLDLEDERDRAKLSADPHFFLRTYENRCVVLDEVQQMPEFFRLLRGIIDENRRPGRFILLGSASPELLRQSSESLAGRIAYVELSPLHLGEISAFCDWQTHWFRGGFPESLLAPDGALSLSWRRNFIRSYLERDLPRLGLSADPILIRRFWQMLAGENGGIWQGEKFARALGVSGHTVKSYLSFLENAFLVTSLQPWFPNVSKRIVKSPKVYQRDSGILHAWMDFNGINDLLGSTALGASWEGYVLEQIKNHSGEGLSCFFYRTHQGAECDIVLVKGHSPVAGIEIKFSSAPIISKGFYSSIADLGTRENYIIIPGEEDYQPKEGIRVTGLTTFLKQYLPAYN